MRTLIRLGNNVGSLLVVPHRRLARAWVVWGVLAAFSLIVGVASATTRSDAYWEVRHWLEVWRAGTDVYSQPRLGVDYPPYALVALWPLAWLPVRMAAPVFAGFNTVVCAVSTWLLVSVMARLSGVALTRAERAAYVLMFLSLTPVRVCIWCGQTTPIVLLFLCLAARIMDDWPLVAGVCLGLGTIKPHAAVGFLIIFAFKRRFAALAVATAVIASLTLVYCSTVGRSVLLVGSEYYHSLTGIYGGPTFLRGEVDMRPFFIDLLGNYGIGETMFLATSAALGLVLAWLAWRVRLLPRGLPLVFSTALMWSLAVFPFRRYGLLLIAPIALYFLWVETVSRRTMQLLGLVMLSLLIDVPFVIRHLIVNFGPPALAAVEPHVHYVNRVAIVVFLFIGLTRLMGLAQDAREPSVAVAPAL